MTLSGYFMTKCVFGQHFLNQNVRNSTTSAILLCSVHFTVYMYLYLYSYRRETARQLRMYAQLTRCFSAVAEILV